MGGFHFIDLIVIAGIALVIFGPKMLESMSRSAGKGVGHAKTAKDKVIAELPMEEISEITSHIPQIPTHPHQVVQMLMGPEKRTEQELEKKAINE